MSAVEIIVKMDKFPQLIAGVRPRVEEALMEVAGRIYDTASNLVPVRTGHLKSTIFVRPQGPGEVSVGADAEYAAYVELSTRYMPAQPFLLPAFNNHKDELPGLIGKAVISAVGG